MKRTARLLVMVLGLLVGSSHGWIASASAQGSSGTASGSAAGSGQAILGARRISLPLITREMLATSGPVAIVDSDGSGPLPPLTITDAYAVVPLPDGTLTVTQPDGHGGYTGFQFSMQEGGSCVWYAFGTIFVWIRIDGAWSYWELTLSQYARLLAWLLVANIAVLS